MQKNSTKIQEIDSWQLQESDPVSDQDTWRLCCHLDSSWIVQSKEHVWSNFEAETTSHLMDVIVYGIHPYFLFLEHCCWLFLPFLNGLKWPEYVLLHPLGSPYRCRVARSLHCSWLPEAGCRNLQGLRCSLWCWFLITQSWNGSVTSQGSCCLEFEIQEKIPSCEKNSCRNMDLLLF